jgi:hypothetical protein
MHDVGIWLPLSAGQLARLFSRRPSEEDASRLDSKISSRERSQSTSSSAAAHIISTEISSGHDGDHCWYDGHPGSAAASAAVQSTSPIVRNTCKLVCNAGRGAEGPEQVASATA